MIKKILRKLIISISSIYTINLFLGTINIYIPFNIYTLIVSYIMGLPGLIVLIIMSYVV